MKKKKYKKKNKNGLTVSDKIDSILTNRILALPIFALIMFLVYYLSVGVVGSFTVDWVAGIVEKIGESTANALQSIGTSKWLISLVVDGIIAGVGAVLGFVPQLIILFICILLNFTGCELAGISSNEEKEFQEWRLIATYDYGMHIKDKATILLDYNRVFFNLFLLLTCGFKQGNSKYLGILAPYTSASIIPTFLPSLLNAYPKLHVTLVFPTPPFPDATIINFVFGLNTL